MVYDIFNYSLIPKPWLILILSFRGSSIKDVHKSGGGGQAEADICGHWGRGSSKSGRPHLVQNLSIYLLDHGENHDSKKYKYTLKLMIFNFTNLSFIQKVWNWMSRVLQQINDTIEILDADAKRPERRR